MHLSSRWFAAIALAVLGLFVAACGGGGSSSTSAGSTGQGQTSASASVKAAKEFAQPYVEHPTPFPVTEPLKEVPTGATVDYLEIPTAIAAIEWKALSAAAKTMGVHVKRIRAGEGAQGVSSAMDTIVSEKPDGVIIVAADPILYSTQLKELQEDGVAIAASAIVDGEKYGIEGVTDAPAELKVQGEVMAAYLYGISNGESKNFVFYNTPELSFSPIVGEGAEAKLKQLCSECTWREATITIPEIGTTSPKTVVSDLQAHPETQAAIFNNENAADQLPPALKTAGLELDFMGTGSDPLNLEHIQSGEQIAGLPVDLSIQMWTALDQIARQLDGQPVAPADGPGQWVFQIATKENLAGLNPAEGWTGYPDYPERFAKLWGVGN